MGTIINNNTTVAKCTQRKAAASQYIPASGTITVHAQPVTQQQVEGVYQTCLDTRKTLVNLRGQVAAALAARKEADAAMKSFDVGLKDWVSTTFGPTSQQAVDFGYAKKQPSKVKVADKAVAVQKAEATKKARGTGLGSKQLKKITAPAPAAAATPAAPGASVTSPAAPAAAKS